MSSLREIARQAGVSVATVSRVLNNGASVSPEMRERVMTVTNRLGYSLPAPQAGGAIGLVYTQEVTVSHPYDAAVLGGVVRGLRAFGLDVLILGLGDRRPGESYTRFFQRKGLRGALLRTSEATHYVCREIADEGFPHVVISDRFDEPGVNYIDCDSRADTRRAVEYLVGLGHERIAFAMHNIPDRDHMDRFEGYREALAAAGRPHDDGLVLRHPFNLAGGASALEMAMNAPDRPTAIFFADPLLAIGAVNRAHAMGIQVPRDVSIVGFDDAETRFSVYPTLTAVCQDAHALGSEAACWLARSTRDGGEKTLRRSMPTFFEVNASTCPPAKSVTQREPRGTLAHAGA